MQKRWKIPVQLVSLIFIVSAVVRAWYNPSGAHGTRQVDTAGLSLALASDFRLEGFTAFLTTAFFPRVLQRGLFSGINAAEFPLLNLLTAPFFLLGPHWGTFLSSLFLLGLNLGIAAYSVSRLLKAWNIKSPPGWGIFLFVSIGSVAFQSGILMPEGLAFPLLLLGASEYCTPTRQWPRTLFSLFCLSLAVAVKPMAVIGFIAIATYPFQMLKNIRHQDQEETAQVQQNSIRWRTEFYLGLLVALAFPAWWYGVHSNELIQRTEGIQVFLKADFNPLAKLNQVGFMGALSLLWRQLNLGAGQFSLYSGWILFPISLFYAPLELAILLVSVLCVIPLAGAHVWVHYYYFFGAGLSSILLLSKLVQQTERNPILHFLCLLALLWGGIYSFRTNLWVTARTPNWWPLAEEIQAVLPQDAHLVTDDAEDATHLLFLGRPGTIASSEVLDICNAVPYRAKKLALLITEPTYQLSLRKKSSCLNSSKLIRISRRDFATWRLYLYDEFKVETSSGILTGHSEFSESQPISRDSGSCPL